MNPLELIANFVGNSTGLEIKNTKGEMCCIYQQADGHSISFLTKNVEDVLARQDMDGRDFLQVNFLDGKKILITEKLVGFKPIETAGLDLKKLPKVVTTPDLVSVIEAIEESYAAGNTRPDEIDVLKKVYDSVLQGAISVGFDVEQERAWLSCISNNRKKISA